MLLMVVKPKVAFLLSIEKDKTIYNFIFLSLSFSFCNLSVLRLISCIFCSYLILICSSDSRPLEESPLKQLAMKIIKTITKEYIKKVPYSRRFKLLRPKFTKSI